MINSPFFLWVFFLGAVTVLAIIIGILAILFKSRALCCSTVFLLCQAFWTWSTFNLNLNSLSSLSLSQSVVQYSYWSAPSVLMGVAGLAVLWWLDSPRKDRLVKVFLNLNLLISIVSISGMYVFEPKMRLFIIWFIQPMVQISLIWLACLQSKITRNIKSELLTFAIPLSYFPAWFTTDFLLRPNELTDLHLVYAPIANLIFILALTVAVLRVKIGIGGNAIRFSGYEKKWDHLTLLPISLEFIRQLEKRFFNLGHSEQHTIILSIALDEKKMRHSLNLNSIDIDEIYVLLVNRIQEFNKFSDVVGRYTNDTFVAVFSIADIQVFTAAFARKIREPFIISTLMGAPITVTVPLQIRYLEIGKKAVKVDFVLYELNKATCI